MDEQRSFLGTGWRFPPAFDPRDRHAHRVSDEDDVRESLLILLSTAPGERVMQPTYGVGLQRKVFAPIDDGLLAELRHLIEQAVLFFEPRVTLEHLAFDLDDPLGGVLRLRLDYRLRSTNSRYNLVYPIYLLEATGLGQQA